MTENVPAEIGSDYGEDAPSKARAWLGLIERSNKAGFERYNELCTDIEKEFASLEQLANSTRDSEFQIFWANVQVLGPSVYSRPPVPVVTPSFQSRDPLKVATAELLERCSVTGYRWSSVDYTLRLARDDLTTLSRGVVRLRYEEKEKDRLERVCIDHVHRDDFAHDPARNWSDVDWVAFRAFMTKSEIKKRKFKNLSGDEAFEKIERMAYAVHKDQHDTSDGRLKVGVWEIWSKSQNKVIWVADGANENDDVLEEDEPHLKLEGFFPCPRPAFGTVHRGNLVPVPDWVYYRDQIREINKLTNRISLLADALKLRAFYPAGAGDIGDAIKQALSQLSDSVVFVPVSNWNLLASAKDSIVWLPLQEVAQALTSLVAMRKELIQDVYEITGLSDIMRGSTNPNETLGAQQLKAQTGSVRIRDRQEEMVRLALDITRMSAEIMAEEFASETLFDMAQVEAPTDAEIRAQVKEIERQIAEAKQDPRVQQMMQQNPQMVQEAEGKARAQIDSLEEQPTREKMVKLLKDERLRPYMFDIETDSTIAPDENAMKQRATEYVTAMSNLLSQAQIVQQVPELGPVISEVIKFANQQFRVGRQVQATVDEFADQMKGLASQPKPPDPEQARAQADAQAAQAKAQSDAQAAQAAAAKTAADAQAVQADAFARAQEAQTKAQDAEAARQIRMQEAQDAAANRAADLHAKQTEAGLRMQQAAEKHAQEMEKGSLDIILLKTKIDQAQVATDNSIAATNAAVNARAQASESRSQA